MCIHKCKIGWMVQLERTRLEERERTLPSQFVQSKSNTIIKRRGCTQTMSHSFNFVRKNEFRPPVCVISLYPASISLPVLVPAQPAQQRVNRNMSALCLHDSAQPEHVAALACRRCCIVKTPSLSLPSTSDQIDSRSVHPPTSVSSSRPLHKKETSSP